MNNEIKEILGYMKQYVEEPNAPDYNGEYPQPWEITIEEVQCILDYITNLQQKIEQYENPDDMTLFYMWLDVKAKDKIKELQQENERLKKEIEECKKNGN